MAVDRGSIKKKNEAAAREKYQLGYIHNPKTAGTSIARAFGVHDSHHPIALRRELDGDHRRIKWATTIRNPWDRMRSWFFYHEISKQKVTFEEWVLRGCKSDWKYPPADVRILYQEDWFEIDGECAVDYLMKFENIDAEFNRLCEWLGVDDPPKMLHIHLQRHHYQTIKARPYWENYTPRMRELVAPICEPFADKYGYKFGE